jgi:dolichol kinase
MFGRTNEYYVKDFIWKCQNTKSLAGSGNILFVSSIVFFFFFGLVHGYDMFVAFKSIAYGLAVAILEAFSPRGLDNMLIIVIGPIVVSILLYFI